ncbi:MAG TPA: Tim44/TimA family putative adaptor protein [Candidatus Sulfotelmatobacter sp.]|jgi:predicted lipid-binding transport protein (Tim44 family)|nr:Tim44/TimA family putative adaptor protein [Candidatus Sulfotelmatobacter sp.]
MPYLDILILALVAVFVGLRLRSVLGRREEDDDEIIPPPRQAPPNQRIGNIIHPAAWGQPVPAREATPLEQIAAADPTFSPDGFLNGARAAFAMIVDAFVRGDEAALRPLLADDVFVNFSRAIRNRAETGEVCANQLDGILSAEIAEARLDGRFARVTVRFQSRQVICSKDAQGSVVFGDAEARHVITDLWSFARDVANRDPNWLLVATQSALEA